MLPTTPSSALFDWVAVASLFGFAAMGADKLLAVGRRSRVSERSLWLTALLGGVLGIIVGGLVFHHKTSKTEFWVPVAVAAVLWAVVAIALTKPHVF
ncbi:MAG TPA: DUF1294 domain-containing protein [Nitrososphaerales archaeon]|nr:DUF1294 domain-containing protein [Nitrososphaerales archaeon]